LSHHYLSLNYMERIHDDVYCLDPRKRCDEASQTVDQ
jgi:hypothetical protein